MYIMTGAMCNGSGAAELVLGNICDQHVFERTDSSNSRQPPKAVLWPGQ